MNGHEQEALRKRVQNLEVAVHGLIAILLDESSDRTEGRLIVLGSGLEEARGQETPLDYVEAKDP